VFSAEEALATPFQDGWRNTGHRSVKRSVTISYADLDRSPARASYAILRQGSRHRSQRSRERTCSFNPPLCSRRSGGLVSSCQQTGPALALIDPLRQGRPVADLMDGLSTLTRFRLSRLSADPDAMRVGVIFTGTATALILSKSIGRHRPQCRVGKSMHVCCRPGRSLALHARKETGASRPAEREAGQQGMRGMVPILSGN
jgi:hypothetical protein